MILCVLVSCLLLFIDHKLLLQTNSYVSTPNHMSTYKTPGDKRLLVKVVRAAQLGGAQGCSEPYCVVEMDEPPQKNQTSVQKNTDSPYWDEHFLL